MPNASKKKEAILPLLSLILLGLVVLHPFCHFHTPLATGDNGRDLYAFRQTLDGAMPYRDYYWVYGPLMPFYYALFMKILGISIPSILAGQILLWLTSGVLMALILRKAGLGWLGWTAALWFWAFNPHFTYTYNHAGGVTCIMALVLLMFGYLRRPSRRYLFAAFLISLLLGLIKLNIGLAAMLAGIICVTLIDRANAANGRKNHAQLLIGGAIVITGLLGAVYFGLLHPLPVEVIRQCMPYLSPDRASHTSLPNALLLLVRHYIDPLLAVGPNLIFAFIIYTAFLMVVTKLLKPEPDDPDRKTILFYLGIPFLFWFLLLHEFFLSAVPYRLFWITPLQTLLIFLILGLGFRSLKPAIRTLVGLALLAVVLLAHVSLHAYIRRFQVPGQFLPQERGQVYVANPRDWVRTVNQTVEYIDRELLPHETFLALPYDPLYYYLCDRTSPTRQLFFYAYMHISPSQEKEILKTLATNNVRLILLSNRAHSQIPEVGTFGQTHLPMLGKTIENDFTLIKTFGDWEKPGGAFKDHAIRIYQRQD